MKAITADEVKKAMISSGIDRVEHHGCSICGQMTFYFRDGEQLFFNSGCGCSWSEPKPRSWDSAADWINMQSNGEVRRKLKERFGFLENSDAV